MSRKALKVVVELFFRSVSCPGVHLPSKDDVFLSMFIMGQYGQSVCLPPVFPLLFHEKMTFEKIFKYAYDPGDIAVLLEHETVQIKLLQVTPPGEASRFELICAECEQIICFTVFCLSQNPFLCLVGETLAFFEESARLFFFPEPKLVPCLSGVDREVLMTRAPSFRGIAPRLEFCTSTTIIECSANEVINIHPNVSLRPLAKPSKKRRESGIPSPQRGRSPVRTRFRDSLSSRSRSPSPVRVGSFQNLARLSLEDTSQPVLQVGRRYDSPSESICSETNLRRSSSPSLRSFRGPSLASRTPSSCSSRDWEEVHERVRGLLTAPRAVRRLTYGASHAEVEDVLCRNAISPGPPW
ncbi:spermatogenesis associated 6-like protein isoform 1-T1 [Synchiropus picturatus]